MTKAPAPPRKAIKANAPSETVLASAEAAKARVQKVGEEATRGKMAARAAPLTTSTEAPTASTAAPSTPVASTKVAEKRKPGGKRRAVKGLGLVLAAGAVALGRNAVRAYFGPRWLL